MKKTIDFLKKYQLIGVFIGLLISGITLVIAESINSNEVLYDNTNSNTSSDNVQDALDEMYNIIEHNSTGFSLLMHSPTGLSTELIGGLYRYQGIQDSSHTVDNYICFGTTNKNDCVSNTDKYMYRIIGVNSSGQMKLIKKETLNTKYQWNSSSNVEWPGSDLFAGLNGSYFLTNTTYVPNSTWSNKIAAADWHYLTTTSSTPSTIIERELGAETVNAKIGLMYLHDVAYTLGTPNYNNTSWIYLSKNDADANDFEWTITRYNTTRSWDLSSNAGYRDMITTRFVRPVFYLQASERIASGSGTITDPYTLS